MLIVEIRSFYFFTRKIRNSLGSRYGLEDIRNNFRRCIYRGASAALIVASAMGVLAGTLLSEYINEKYLHYVAGFGFIVIGGVTLYNA